LSYRGNQSVGKGFFHLPTRLIKAGVYFGRVKIEGKIFREHIKHQTIFAINQYPIISHTHSKITAGGIGLNALFADLRLQFAV
jgi:hypothetical protein